MKHSRHARPLGLALLFALAMLAACAPFGVQAPQPLPRSAIATTTAAAYATFGASATPVANLPQLSVDPGWVAVVQVAYGARLGGPEVSGGAPGSGTASTTMTIGTFTLSSAATVVFVFGCASRAGVHATVEISVSDGGPSQIQCAPAGATTRDQLGLLPSDAGRKLTVTATISTDSVTPQWNLLVEQPK